MKWPLLTAAVVATVATRGLSQQPPAQTTAAYDSQTGFTLDWTYNEAQQVITFTAVSQSTGYVSVGFTAGGKFHAGGDCYTAWVIGGQPTAVDSYFQGTALQNDPKNDYTLISATEVNGVTTVVFSRPIALKDADDFEIKNQVQTVFWAIGPDGTGNTYGYHDTYQSFTVNLLDANAVIGSAPFEIDPGFGLTLSIAGPFALFTLFKLYQDYQKGSIRDYRIVSGDQTPVGRWAAGVARRMSTALGFQQGGGAQTLPVNSAGMYGPGPGGPGGPGGYYPPPQGGGFGRRMSSAFGAIKERIVRTNLAPKPAQPSGMVYEFKQWGRQRLNSEMTYLQASLMLLYVAIAVAWVYLPENYLPADNWGYICCASALFVVIPATRNSLLTWFLFTPFERTILYHRYLGRFTFLAGLLHTMYYVVQWIQEGTLSANLQREKIRNGIYSMIGLTAVFLTSFDQIRRKHYNFFRLFHYTFFAFYVFGVLHTQSFLIYTIITGVLYGTDLIMRYTLDLFPKNAYAVDILPGEVIRLRFPKNNFKTYHSGQYVFLNFPSISLGEWHPFTLSSGPHQDYLEVHIKALGDFTRQLLNEGGKLMAGQVRSFPRVRVDGPYGRISFSINRYQNLLLVGGGVGVTPMIAVLKELFQIDVSEEKKRRYPISPHVKNVYFLWVVRDPAPWTWFFDTLKQAMAISVNGAAMGYPKLRIKGYVTKPDQNTANLQQAITNIPYYSVSAGRPDVPEILKGVEASIEAVSGRGPKRIGTLCCGPSKLVNSVWDECHKRTRKGVMWDIHREEFDF